MIILVDLKNDFEMILYKFKNMLYIYILELEDNKYYIGKTTNPNFRLQNHNNGNGSAWTSKYKPIKLLELIPNCDHYDEDKYTRIYMDKYGIDNVRGGAYVQLKLDDITIKHLNQLSISTNNKCFICEKTDHYAKQCPHNICTRCGHKSHNISKCYAEKHITGYKLHKNKINNFPELQSFIDISSSDSSSDSSNDNDYYKNYIKHINDNDDYYQNYMKTRELNKSTATCLKCKRIGHYSSECNETTDKYGNQIYCCIII
jgi:hypothetical protein